LNLRTAAPTSDPATNMKKLRENGRPEKSCPALWNLDPLRKTPIFVRYWTSMPWLGKEKMSQGAKKRCASLFPVFDLPGNSRKMPSSSVGGNKGESKRASTLIFKVSPFVFYGLFWRRAIWRSFHQYHFCVYVNVFFCIKRTTLLFLFK